MEMMEKSRGSIVMYQTEDGGMQLDVHLENDTVWLTQAQMAMLFQRDRTVIGRHIKNVFKEHELDPNITCANFAHVGKDEDQEYNTIYYNLDVIISVGYRVKSQTGTRFRIWANSVLKDYLVKGYAVRVDMEREKYEQLSSFVKVLGRTVVS